MSKRATQVKDLMKFYVGQDDRNHDLTQTKGSVKFYVSQVVTIMKGYLERQRLSGVLFTSL